MAKGGVSLDRLNILKELLRTTFQAQLWHRGIIWQHEERLFIFVPTKKDDGAEEMLKTDVSSLRKPIVRKETWSQGKKEGRIVYREIMREDDPSKLKFQEHLAFQVGFDLYDEQWYLAVKPDLFCSNNGYKKSWHHKNRVSFVKRKDHNPDVLTDLLFITEILRKDQNVTLLDQNLGPRITLGELVTLDGATPIKDSEWQQQEEKKKRKALTAKIDRPLINAYET